MKVAEYREFQVPIINGGSEVQAWNVLTRPYFPVHRKVNERFIRENPILMLIHTSFCKT